MSEIAAAPSKRRSILPALAAIAVISGVSSIAYVRESRVHDLKLDLQSFLDRVYEGSQIEVASLDVPVLASLIDPSWLDGSFKIASKTSTPDLQSKCLSGLYAVTFRDGSINILPADLDRITDCQNGW